MIGLWSLLVGVVLLTLLLMIGLKGLLTARELEEESDASASDRARMELCSAEFAAKIFSRDDWDFVSKMNCAGLEALFRRERRAVALLWVRHTAADIRAVMREHAAAARRSPNLNPVTEVKLFLQYAELMLICGVLLAAIQLAGPLRLRHLALYAQGLSQRIADAQLAFQAAADARGAGVAGSS